MCNFITFYLYFILLHNFLFFSIRHIKTSFLIILYATTSKGKLLKKWSYLENILRLILRVLKNNALMNDV